jgi:hypothetical protein
MTGVTLRIEERITRVAPLGMIQKEADIEALAKKISETVGG